MTEFHIGWLVIAAFAGIVLWAVINDCLSFRIPNSASIALLLLYPAWLAVAWPPTDPWQTVAVHVGIGIAALAAGFILFVLRAFGAGDAKLLAVIALWAGPGLIFQFVIATAIAGGALSLVIIIARRFNDAWALEVLARDLASRIFGRTAAADAAPGPPSDMPAQKSGGTAFARPIPYGVAIGAGAALVAYGLLTTSGAS